MSKPFKFMYKGSTEEPDVHIPGNLIKLVVSKFIRLTPLTTILSDIFTTLGTLDRRITDCENNGGSQSYGGDTGIRDMSITNDNALVITLTDGSVYNLPINVDNIQSTQITSVSEVTSIGSGTLQEAIDYAEDNHLNTHFQWLLIDEDENGDEVTKLIWHIGSGHFIDALGCPISQTR